MDINVVNARRQIKVRLNKIYYPLAEAAELAHCQPRDLLNYALQGHIKLLTVVPEWVDVRCYGVDTKKSFSPFLLPPDCLRAFKSTQRCALKFTQGL